MTKSAFLATALAGSMALAAATVATPAEAYHHHHHGGGAVAAGIAGLAIGAIVGGAVSRDRYYDAPPPAYYGPPPRPVYAEPEYGPEPWTREWYAYCASKYRTFDAQSGTFQPYNGPRQLCR